MNRTVELLGCSPTRFAYTGGPKRGVDKSNAQSCICYGCEHDHRRASGRNVCPCNGCTLGVRKHNHKEPGANNSTSMAALITLTPSEAIAMLCLNCRIPFVRRPGLVRNASDREGLVRDPYFGTKIFPPEMIRATMEGGSTSETWNSSCLHKQLCQSEGKL